MRLRPLVTAALPFRNHAANHSAPRLPVGRTNAPASENGAQRLLSGMGAHVPSDTRFLDGRVGAHAACEGLLPGVGAYVLVKMRASAGRVGTHAAGEVLLPGVSVRVPGKTRALAC